MDSIRQHDYNYGGRSLRLQRRLDADENRDSQQGRRGLSEKMKFGSRRITARRTKVTKSPAPSDAESPAPSAPYGAGPCHLSCSAFGVRFVIVTGQSKRLRQELVENVDSIRHVLLGQGCPGEQRKY